MTKERAVSAGVERLGYGKDTAIGPFWSAAIDRRFFAGGVAG
jgi:hypothetical protein